jgi:hypothetical protein
VIFTLFYLSGLKKNIFKKKSKNTSRLIKVTKTKTVRKTKKKIKKKVQKKVKNKSQKRSRKNLNKKIKQKPKAKSEKKAKKLIKKSVKKQIKRKSLSSKEPYQYDTSALKPKKYKSILIKPTAKRIKNIKLARQLALKSTENMTKKEKNSERDLTLDDFIQEDLANSPSVLLNPPTKTELRTSQQND